MAVFGTFAYFNKIINFLTIIFYIERAVLSLTAIVSGVKILIMKIAKAFSVTDGTVDNHRGAEKAVTALRCYCRPSGHTCFQ